MSGINLVASDLVVSNNATVNVRERLERMRSGGSSLLSTYGANAIVTSDVVERQEYISNHAEAVAFTQWVLKSWQHAEYITKKPELLLDLFNKKRERVTVRYAGIESSWALNIVEDFVLIKFDSLDKLFKDIATKVDTSLNNGYGVSSGRTLWVFNEHKLYNDYLTDSNAPLLPRAMWNAKRDALRDAITSSWTNIATVDDNYVHKGQLFFQAISHNTGLTVDAYISARNVVDTYNNYKTNPKHVRMYRDRVLQLQSESMRTESIIRRQVAAKNFNVFWQTVKQRQRKHTVDFAKACEVWATIPLQDAGAESSRTWGIEIETVRAGKTSRPAGWKQHHDGSLEADGECNCSCDACYDGEHSSCNYDNEDCDYDDNNCAEFVSPILNHFNSNGLRQLCNDIPTYESNTTPGIHVHVGADDLTVSDVARLLYAYSVAAPLLEPIYQRDTTGYCKEMDSQNIQFWLSAVRNYMRDGRDVPTPAMVAQNQPADRYQDVNVQALYKHETIEFRAMGPHYDYEYLVRWAWFCREMVNVSKLGLDNSVWLKCTSLEDVIKVLRTYGSESYSSILPINTNDLVLVEN